MLELPEGVTPGGRFTEWAAQPPRYLVADVDGTLLAKAHLPTPAVLDAAAACAPAGLRLGVATGRMPHAVTDLVRRLGAQGPHVVHNGAEVWADGRMLASWPLPPDVAIQMADMCRSQGYYCEFYVGDGYWVTDRRAAAGGHWDLLRKEPDGDVAELDLRGVEVLKATVILFEGDDPRPVERMLHAAGLSCGAAHAPALPEAVFLNVTHPEADKGRALAVAADAVEVDLAQVVAVGDGLNDLSMLRIAGTAIAMGQASEQVRDAAHLLVPELDSDGVAHALRAAAAWCVSTSARG